MNNPNFKPTGMWQSTRDKEIAAFEAGVEYGSQHWKSNHHNVVKKLRLFTQRTDLPVDRIPAFEYVRALEKEVKRLHRQLSIAKKSYKE